MAENYCAICRKMTPHKSIMRRSSTQYASKLQEVIALLVKGTHYYEMEHQQFCRVCNHQNQVTMLSVGRHGGQQAVSR